MENLLAIGFLGLLIGFPLFMAYANVTCKLCRKTRSRWATVCPHCGRDV